MTDQTLTFLGLDPRAHRRAGRIGVGRALGRRHATDAERHRLPAGRPPGAAPARSPSRWPAPATSSAWPRARSPAATPRRAPPTTSPTAAHSSSSPTRRCPGDTRPARSRQPERGAIHPWLVLVVGTEGDRAHPRPRTRLALAADVQQLHPIGAPTTAARFAHVQLDGAGHRIGRVLYGRPLSPGHRLPGRAGAGLSRGWRSLLGRRRAGAVPVYDSLALPHRRPGRQLRGTGRRLTPGDAPVHHRAGPADATRGWIRPPTLQVLGALGAGPRRLDRRGPAAARGGHRPGRAAHPRHRRARPADRRPCLATATPGPTTPTSAAWGEAQRRSPAPRRGRARAWNSASDCRTTSPATPPAAGRAGRGPAEDQPPRAGAHGVAGLWQRRLPSDADEHLWLMGPALGRLVMTGRAPWLR